MIIQLLLVTEDNSISTVFHREDAPPTLEVVGEVDLPAAALPLPNDHLRLPDGTTYVVVRRVYNASSGIALQVAVWRQGFYLQDYH